MFSKYFHVSSQSRISEEKLLAIWFKIYYNGKQDLEVKDRDTKRNLETFFPEPFLYIPKGNLIDFETSYFLPGRICLR